MNTILSERARARLSVVEEHVRRENAHECGLFSFDEAGKLSGERIYYDRAGVLRQVGLYRDPQSVVGQLEMLLAHPVTLARAYARKLFRSAS